MGNTNNSDMPTATNSVAKQTPAKARKPPKRFDPDPKYLRPSDDPNHWNNSSSYLAILPPEIIVEIFSLLGAKELAVLSQSCKKSREIAYDYDKFWEAYMDIGLKRYKVTDDLAIEVISKFGPVKSNWNFAICEQIHNQTLEYLNKYCSTIALLNLASCRNITDQGIMQFTNKFASLTELNLSHTDITNAGLKHVVTYAPRLSKLILKATRLSDLTMLESLHNLTELDLSAPRLMGYEIKFPVIPSLKTLRIAKFQFPSASQGTDHGSDELIKALQLLPNLTALDVSCTSAVIINAIGSMKHLTWLGARAEGHWTDVDIQKTLQSICPSLTYLDMSGGQDSNQWHQMIVVAVENGPNLKTLVINNNFRLSTRYPKLFDLIYEHMNLTYLEGYGYVFDGNQDKELVQRLRTKPGLKVVTDGI